MSLKTALLNAENINIENGILTLTDSNAGRSDSVLYSCFIRDITLSHPQLGKGNIISYVNNKWICDFYFSSLLTEMTTHNIIKFIN